MNIFNLSVGILFFLLNHTLDLNPAMALAADSYTLETEMSFNSKKFDQVIKDLSPLIENLDRKGLLMLGQAYYGTADYQSAVNTYNAALSLNGKDYEAKTLLGEALFKSGKKQEALAALKEAVEINSKYIPAYIALISQYESIGNKYELRLLYQDMIDSFGEKSEYILKACELNTLSGMHDMAQTFCRKGITKYPNVVNNYVNLGLTLKDTGELVEAEKYLKLAAEKFSDSELAQISYANLLNDQKNFIAAYKFYIKASQSNPNSKDAYIGIGKSALELKKYDESLSGFKKACFLDKTSITEVRRAANIIRTSKNRKNLEPFEKLTENCHK